ncbi:MAG: ORF6N domain-containing protein [Candidatus Omnitrophica bacterium]|nr:ORF6N domain-containing protein [Candidatus Omnitrophota bacterium]
MFLNRQLRTALMVTNQLEGATGMTGNSDRFPEDFVFRLTADESTELRDSAWRKPVTGSQRHRDPRHTPYAFTEHGAIMAASVLNIPRAVEMSVFVVRAFVRMRSMLTEHRGLAIQLADLEEKLTKRLDIHEAAIVDILRRIMTLLDPPPPPPTPRNREIGFHAGKDKAQPARRINRIPAACVGEDGQIR